MSMQRAAERADALSRGIAVAMTGAAALAVGLIVVVLVFSSLQRYVLAAPIPATEEIAAYLFVCVAFASMVGGLVEGRHIRVLPLWRRLPAGAQNWAMLAGHAFSIAVLGVLVRETFGFAWSSYRLGARSYVANLPEWPWMMVIPACLTLLALAVALRAFGDLERALRAAPAPEARAGGPEEAI